DAGVGHQPLDVGRPEPGDGLCVEAGEGAAVALALAQDGRPGEPRLRARGHPAAPGSGVVRGSQWAILDSNQGPPPYQSGALTDCANRPRREPAYYRGQSAQETR